MSISFNNDSKRVRRQYTFYRSESWEGPDTSKLDFDVIEKPITVGEFVVPDKKGLFRDNDVYLATVSNTYPIIKHSEIVSNIEEGMNFSDASIKTILSKDGIVMQRTYTLPKIQREVKKNDVICPVIRVVNSYDGSTVVGFYLDALRLVCTNGMTSVSQFMGMSYKHFGNKFSITDFASNAKSMLEGFNEYSNKWGEWTRTPLSLNTSNLLVGFLPKRFGNLVKSNFDENLDGTKWGFYNAITATVSHNYFSKRAFNMDEQRIKIGTKMSKFMDNKIWAFDDAELSNRLSILKNKKTIDLSDDDFEETA